MESNLELSISKINKNTIEIKPTENLIENENFNKGDLVRIVRLENSRLNVFKGYYGEIKSYKKGSKTASIFLEAVNSGSLTIFPINHFVKRNY